LIDTASVYFRKCEWINTLLFEYDQIIIADSEDNLQRRLFTLKNTLKIKDEDVFRKRTNKLLKLFG